MQPQLLYCQDLIVYIAYKPRCVWCSPSHPPGAPAVPHSWSATSWWGLDVTGVTEIYGGCTSGVCMKSVVDATVCAHSWMLLVVQLMSVRRPKFCCIILFSLHSACTQQCLYSAVSLLSSASSQRCLYSAVPLLSSASTQRCLYSAVPLLSVASTQRCLHSAVSLLSGASTQRCLYSALPLLSSASTQRCLYSTVPLLSGASTQQCLYSAVPLLSGAPQTWHGCTTDTDVARVRH